MRLSTRSQLWITTSTGVMVTLVTIITMLALDLRLEERREVQEHLAELKGLVDRLGAREKLSPEAARNPAVAAILDRDLVDLYRVVGRWERLKLGELQPETESVTLAVQRYAEDVRRLVLLLREPPRRPEAERWLTGEVMPAYSLATDRIAALEAGLVTEIAQVQRIRRVSLFVLPWLGLSVTLILLWRLEGTKRRAAQLEEEQREYITRDRHITGVLRNLVDPVIIVDKETEIRYVSAGVHRVFGYSIDEARGMRAIDLVHPDDWAELGNMAQALAEDSEQEHRAELRVLHADGTYRQTEVVAGNLLADPDIQGILTQVRDVTDRKWAEEALRESETRLRSTLRQLPAILFLVDRDLQIIDGAGAGLRTLGFSADAEFRGSLAEVFQTMDGGAEYLALFQRALAGEPVEMEGEFLGRVLRTCSEPFRNADGEIVGVLSIALDITDSVRAKEALREKEQLHRLVTEHSAELVVLVRPDGTVTYVSPSALGMLGYTPEEYAGIPLGELVHPADRPAVEEANRRSRAGEPAAVSARIRKKDGAYVWFETLSRPVRNGEGALVATVVSSRDITERKRFEDQLAFMAYHDDLTLLPNRAALVERLSLLLQGAPGNEVAVLLINLDNLKVINDSLGMEAGDQVLIECAARLQEALPAPHLLARFGGDDLAVLLDLSVVTERPARVCEQLMSAFDQPIRLGEREAPMTISLGFTVGRAGESEAGGLLREANFALRHAKQQGKARWVRFEASMGAGAVEELELSADLRRAIRSGELELHYQPVVSLRDGRVTGAEALVRWRHPVLGPIPPGRFIPLAEQSGLIDQLGQWVLREACMEARCWLDLGLWEPHFAVNVNLSAAQFQRSRLAEEIAAVLEETGLPPQHLTLEITESTLMQDPANARSTLQRLKALGIHIAVDDFGTGHSSLSYLKEFPIDILKIDRSFVSGLGRNLVDRALASTVISLARALHLTVTAEGVESAEQVAELKELRCDRAQGYFFARPVPAEELVRRGFDISTRGVS